MESVIRNLNTEEKEAIDKLQLLFKNTLPPKLSKDSTLFYRFLKARDFDINKAETMLKKHINWRKAFQVDTIVDTFKPKEVYQYLKMILIGFGKDGNIIRYAPSGKMDIKDFIRSMKLNDFIKHCIWLCENDDELIKEQNMKTGKDGFQEILIFNLDGMPLSNVTNKASADLMIRFTLLLQDNYPERLKTTYVINAPAYFTILFSIVKKVMSNAMTRKFHVFGQSGWKEALLEVIDADVLPAFLGGDRTDPDGNPLCNTFMYHGGKIPPKYFLSEEERHFKDIKLVKVVEISPNERFKVFVDVRECGSVIQWEFEIKHKDIGFGLFYQRTELNCDELLPVLKFVTTDGTEKGSFVAPSPGTYIIMFDNTHSRWSSKEVQYCVAVKRP